MNRRYLIPLGLMLIAAGGFLFLQKQQSQPRQPEQQSIPTIESEVDPVGATRPGELEQSATMTESASIGDPSTEQTVEGEVQQDDSTLESISGGFSADKSQNVKSVISSGKGDLPGGLDGMLKMIRNPAEPVNLRWKAMEDFKKVRPKEFKTELAKLRPGDPLKRLYRSQEALKKKNQ